MDKLELKHIAPYVLHKVKGEYESPMAGRKVVGEMTGISTNSSYECVDMVSLDLIDMIHIEDVKLFLRPLSDLTKEIEVNGNKFIPIRKLYDIVTGCEWSNTKMLIDGSGIGEWWTGLGSKHFGYNSEKQYFYHLGCDLDYKVKYQLTLFNKLREWHFDVDELIEKDLAIDINTLKQ